MEKCRLCLSEGGKLTHVSEEREGLPLSVIAMIICPIKIERNDNLPKYICDDCVEILVTTYHLRDTSNQNEKYLRELPYTEPLVKQEYLDNVNPIFFEPSIYAEDTRSDDGTFEEPLPSQNLSEPSAKGYTVDCYKHDSKSIAWKYFGALCDSKGNVMDRNFFYCVFCVQEDRLVKFSIRTSTFAYLRHLKRLHFTNELSKETSALKKPLARKVYTCDLCGNLLCRKTSLKRHMQRKHTRSRVATESSFPTCSTKNESHYMVDCYKSKKSSTTSMVWNFFGRLLDIKGIEVHDSQRYHFCRLCNNMNVLTKFSINIATTGLMQHLLTKHGVSSDTKVYELDRPIKQDLDSDFFGDEEQETPGSKQKQESLRTCFDHNTSERSEHICHICSKSFMENYKLTRHMKIHSQISYFCSLCPASFAYLKGLKSHERVHDPSHLSKYKCDQCPNSYGGKKSLRQHFLTVHLKRARVRNHQCDLCDMKFVTSHNLKRHFMKHTGEVRKINQKFQT